ncbi:MAG: hypothetical protein QM723_11025 [Myxococcaceae bacterium]
MKTLALAASLLCATGAFAQYNAAVAGHNAPEPTRTAESVLDTKTGQTKTVYVEHPVQRDGYGNAAGSQNDLAVDGAFDGQTVAVIQLYSGTDLGIPFDFAEPKKALAQKGFSVFRWINKPPSPQELEEKLKKASQLWVIGGSGRQLTEEHAKVIKKFFDSGRGVYLWGDNAPYSEDSNLVIKALFGVELVDHGENAQQVVNVHHKGTEPGVIEDHLLTTGLEHLYEGHTISTLPQLGALKPLIYSSSGNVVSAYYDQQGRRAIVDGGYTRLYLKWDTAGTGRYVKNAAAWLANAERFGSSVVAKKQ